MRRLVDGSMDRDRLTTLMKLAVALMKAAEPNAALTFTSRPGEYL